MPPKGDTAMPCKLCKERGQTWSGDAPRCAFDGQSISDNWNCATVNAIRGICYEGQSPMPPGVDYQYCDDRKYATIKIDSCIMPDGSYIGQALWVSWYKSRGTTDALWILSSDLPPRHPTAQELEAIVDYYAALRIAAARQ